MQSSVDFTEATVDIIFEFSVGTVSLTTGNLVTNADCINSSKLVVCSNTNG